MSAETRQRQRQARLISHAALKYSRTHCGESPSTSGPTTDAARQHASARHQSIHIREHSRGQRSRA